MTQPITLDEWVNQYGQRRKSTRELWKAIRWEFEQQKPPMTVRQMFYRMSSIGQVAKTEPGYRQVQYALSAMREKKAIPYDHIADNTRWVRKPTSYSSLGDMLARSRDFYRRALWDTQPDHVEIWLEKDALSGVIVEITREFDVPLFVTRGYPSITYIHDAAEAHQGIGKPIYVYHFGDYDASGKDAARSIRDGLRKYGASFQFVEVAVTQQQIVEMGLQTRPAKESDPRSGNWGKIAVELDAIPPVTLRDLVRSCIERHIDQAELARIKTIEARERETLAGWIKSISF